MGDLVAHGSALADLRTPPKRARTKPRHLRGEEETSEGPTDVRVGDVLGDIKVFPPSQRPEIERACLRVLCVASGKGGLKMLFVWEKHIDLCLSIVATLVSRVGVPHVDSPADSPADSALADEREWFDIRTNRWHQRRCGTDEVAVSDPVPRIGLTLPESEQSKADALEALTSRA